MHCARILFTSKMLIENFGLRHQKWTGLRSTMTSQLSTDLRVLILFFVWIIQSKNLSVSTKTCQNSSCFPDGNLEITCSLSQYKPCSVGVMSHVPRPYNKVTTDIVHNSLRANQLTTRQEKESVKTHFKSNRIRKCKLYFLNVSSPLPSQQGWAV